MNNIILICKVRFPSLKFYLNSYMFVYERCHYVKSKILCTLYFPTFIYTVILSFFLFLTFTDSFIVCFIWNSTFKNNLRLFKIITTLLTGLFLYILNIYIYGDCCLGFLCSSFLPVLTFLFNCPEVIIDL